MRIIALATLAIGLAASSGCSIIQQDVGSKPPSEASRSLAEQADATVDDVLEMLGPPHAMSAINDGYAFLYHWYAVEERQLGLSSNWPVLRWFRLAIARADIDATALIVHFDDQGGVQAYGLDQRSIDLGGGTGFQPIFVVTPLVDADEYLEDIWPAHLWGMSMLREAPAALNAHAGVDSGMRGLEMRSTSLKVGQRTLEMQKEQSRSSR
ncbi:MAG: hypothetical protein GWM88_06625 [Pseudomonadales bacterium]|nr:hypothetical protein [Pseudomonadales bacterium]NIX07697.1 hypothetical protein [Pseudomonadales bacterium]